MHLRQLSLANFKNYQDCSLEFSPGVNAFVGDNGTGKTNLLDAIHYLSLCKSYFNPIDGQNIRHELDFFVLQGNFELNGNEEHISCGVKRGHKKMFRRNQKEYERLSEHIGLLPVVMISPTDANLIIDGSEERRKFIDSIISQFDRTYLEALISYARVLAQRNAYLRQSGMRSLDEEALDVWNEQLVSSGSIIHSLRRDFLEKFIPVFQEYYTFISGDKEAVGIRYDSHLNEKDFMTALRQSMERDRILQYTSIGPHKDDLVLQINNHPAKKFASQGQQKSFLIAMKLAHFDFVRQRKSLKPILLLDDIFDKLDDSRVERLMELVSKDNFGQIFITDTHPERLSAIFKDIGIPLKTFPVSDGSVTSAMNGKQEIHT